MIGLNIRMHVIIRPRGGDFCYSDVEFEAMQLDIAFAKQAGADGVVIGILNPDASVDVERTRDPFEAMESLIGLGVDRILTSGQEPSVLEGLDLITELVK